MQPKNVTHPTDAKLMLKAVEQLGKLARRHDVPLRQSYVRVAKRAALMAGRYAHAKQFKRCNRELKFPRTHLGRLIRDIRRKTDGDHANAILTATGYNFRLILKWLRALLRLILHALFAALWPRSALKRAS